MTKLTLVAILLAPATASAGGFIIPDETARDLALSESAIANQQGAGAVLLNVAALAGQDGVGVAASGELLVNTTDWSDPALGTASLVPQATYPPAGAVSYGGRLRNGMAYGVGVGFDVAGGGSLRWPQDWPGQEAAQSVTQQMFQLGVGAAFQPVPGVKIGASFLRYQITEEVHQSINYLDHYGDAGLSIAGGGNGFGAGIEVAVPGAPLTLGAIYKHSIDVTLDGDAHFTDVPPAFQPMIHDQGVSERITLPNVAGVGAAYRVTPDVTVMGAYTFERWSVYKSDTFVGSDGFMATVPRDDHNAHLIRAGVEWERTPITRALTLRAGGIRSFGAQPTATVSPSLTDADSWAVSAGAGYDVSRSLRVDLGYQHAFFDAITATGDAFPGTYRSQADLVSVGVNWRMR
jgi:long-chain fatty acid transport protein